MTSNLQPWVVNHYNQSRSKKNMPIEIYIESIIKHMPGVTHDDIYEPVEVNLQLSKFNAVPVQVDFTDGWEKRLKDAVSSMIGQKASDIKFKNVKGQDIESDLKIKTLADLSGVGNLRVYSRGCRVDLKSLPEPPEHMSNDKMLKLSNWFDDSIKEKACDIIAKALVDSPKEDLTFRTSLESNLAKEIQSLVTEGDFKKFLSTYGSNERARNTPPEDVGKSISGNVLRQMRRVLKGSENRINKHIAAKTQLKLKENNEEVLFDTPSSIAGELQDEHEMYSKMARKALALSKHEIINNVYRAVPINCGAYDKKPEEDENNDEDSFYYTKSSYDKMQSLVGRPIYMKIERNVPAPVVTTTSSTGATIRGARFRKKNPELGKISSEMPELIPISSKMPELTPISSEMPELIPLKKKNVPISSEMPKLIPLKNKNASELPKLIPISKKNVPEFGKISSEMPKLIPLKQKNVPISSNARIDIGQNSSKQKSKLFPEFIEIPLEVPRPNDGLPDIYDFLEKKKRNKK
jgi:hypothetical protein